MTAAPRTTRRTRDSDEAVAAALTRYRVLAYVVGVMLLALIARRHAAEVRWRTSRGRSPSSAPPTASSTASTCSPPSTWPCARAGPAKGTVLVLLAGTIPFLSFVAERVVTRRTRAGERV